MGALFAAPLIGSITVGQAISAIGTIASVMGSIQQGRAQKAAGEAQGRAMEHQAALGRRAAEAKEVQAGQERAAAQRTLIGERKKQATVESRFKALGAASGAGLSDPGALDALGDIAAEGDYRALSALYEGEERARSLEYGAMLDRAGAAGDIYAGEAARRAGRSAASRSYLSAAGTLASGASSFYDKYGGTRPKPKRATANPADYVYDYGGWI